MKRAALLIALLPLAGCLSTEDYDHEEETTDSSLLFRLREKSHVETTLTKLSGCNCTADIQPKLVRVSVLPGPRGLPDDDMLRRMSGRVTEITGMPASQHLFVAPGGRVLFSGGIPAP